MVADANIKLLGSSLQRRTWRPWPLCTPFIAFFAALCIGISATIEIIIRNCAATGCRVFGQPSPNNLSTESYFVYNLLPTILSTCVNLLWTTTYHDVMRLEPYFQMSRPGGALVKDSILLDYQYNVSLFVPYLAWKRGHWVVFLASCILFLVTVLITPLASGLFDDGILTKTIPITAARNVLKAGEPKFSAGFTYVAYNYQWLNGSLPGFTTPSYALLPIKSDGLNVDNETWSSETTLFEAEMNCEAAIPVPSQSTQSMVEFFDLPAGSPVLNFTYPSYPEYYCIMWDLKWNPSYLDPHGGLVKIGCPKATQKWLTAVTSEYTTPWTSDVIAAGDDKSEITMFTWASAAKPFGNDNPEGSRLPSNLTAIFCTPSYYSQAVTATFAMPSGNITHVNRTGIRTPFPDGAGFMGIFNRNVPEISTVPAQYIDSAGNITGFGFWPQQIPNVDPELGRRLGPHHPITDNYQAFYFTGQSRNAVFINNVYTLPAWSLYNQLNTTLWELQDPSVLSKTYESAFQLLFALAVAKELVGEATMEVIATREVHTRGFTMNGLWARGVQIGLAVAAIMSAVLAAMNSRRCCELDGEPNSLAATLKLLATSPEVCGQMESSEFHSEKALRRVLIRSGGKYKLVLEQDQGSMIQLTDEQPILLEDEKEPWAGPELWMLKTSTGAGLVAFFVLIAGLLLTAFFYAQRRSGLTSLGGTNSIGYKVLFSYIPVVNGMIIEPVLVNIAAYRNMLGPYQMLRRNDGRSKQSLTVDYNKSPPHFQLPQALRVGNASLIALTAAILLAKVFAVALAGLFSPFDAEFVVVKQLQTHNTTGMVGGFEYLGWDMYYSLYANISSEWLPTWTTPNLYILPFYLLGAEGLETYQGPTVAIGVDIKCKVSEAKNLSVMSDSSTNLGLFMNDTCFQSSEGPLGAWPRPIDDQIIRSVLCPEKFLVYWVELPGDPHPNGSGAKYKDQPEGVLLTCTTKDVAYELTATINQEYQVLSTTNIRPINTGDITSFPGNLTHTFIDSLTTSTTLDLISRSALHWVNYFLATINPETVRQHLVNITNLPNTTGLEAAFEGLFKRLFAIKVRLNSDEIFSPSNGTLATGTATVQKRRVGVNFVMFVLAATILLYITLVIVSLYWWQRPYIPAHIPTSLATMYAMLYACDASVLCGAGNSPMERGQKLEEMFAYGKFIDTNGREHIGVYRISGGVSPLSGDGNMSEYGLLRGSDIDETRE